MPLKRFVDVARDWLGIRTHVFAPPGEHATFLLKYADLLVGTLTVEDCVWHFKYADEFKQSNDLRPLVEFPDLNAVYESKDLWQFFAMRIPSSEQPEVEEILKREEIGEHDAIKLLKRFGARTIANPFELTLAA
jgi:HipA-like protein